MEQYTDNNMCKVSILMSVYNTSESYLREAIESVLTQTFTEYEFIIVNDCSDDTTSQILVEYEDRDNRIVLINNNENIGLTKSLNIGINRANGKYIARLDSDDACKPERLYKQYQYMESHPSVSALGCRVCDEEGRSKRVGVGIPWEYRKVQLITSNCGMVHSSAFIRKSFLDDNSIRYDETKYRAQDYKLWVDIATNNGCIHILNDVLVMYRNHADCISVKYKNEQDSAALKITAEQIAKITTSYNVCDIENRLLALKNNSSDIQNRNNVKEMLIDVVRSNGRNSNPKYSQNKMMYEMMYLYNHLIGKQIWINVGYFLYRIKRSWYKYSTLCIR